MFSFKINYNCTHSLHIRTLDKISQNYALLFLESTKMYTFDTYSWKDIAPKELARIHIKSAHLAHCVQSI